MRKSMFVLGLAVMLGAMSACGDDEAVQSIEKKQEEKPGVDEESKAGSPSQKKKVKAPTKKESRAEVDTADAEAFCDERENPLSKPTVDAIIAATGATTCKQAAAKLALITSLDLAGQDIYDLSPVQYLKNLRMIDISKTKVEAVEHLAELAELRTVIAVDAPGVSAEELKLLDQVESIYLTPGLPLTTLAAVPDEPFEAESCRKGNWFIDPYTSCRHESHGVELYKAARSANCGVERKEISKYKECPHKDHGWNAWQDKQHTLTYLKDQWQEIAVGERNTYPESYCKSKVSQWSETKRGSKSSNAYGFEFVAFTYDNDIQPIIERGPNRFINLRGYKIRNLKCKIDYRERTAKQKRSASCGVESYRTIYKECRHKNHGPERYFDKVSAACPTSGKVAYGKDAQAAKAAALGKPLFCADCSDIAAVDAASTNKKLACFGRVAGAHSAAAIKVARPAFERFVNEKSPWLDVSAVKTAAQIAF